MTTHVHYREHSPQEKEEPPVLFVNHRTGECLCRHPWTGVIPVDLSKEYLSKLREVTRECLG